MCYLDKAYKFDEAYLRTSRLAYLFSKLTKTFSKKNIDILLTFAKLLTFFRCQVYMKNWKIKMRRSFLELL